jgi:hypothetical protein
MKKLKVGRPIVLSSMKRTGRRFMFWLSKREVRKLTVASEILGISRAELLRKLLREFDEEK